VYGGAAIGVFAIPLTRFRGEPVPVVDSAMAAKKKTKKKQTKSKKTPGNKMTPMKKTAKKKLPMKNKTPKKELAKKAAQKKATVKTKAVGKKTIGVKTATALKKQVRAKSQSVDTVAFSPDGSRGRSGQSGDLQGLSNVQGANSESVDGLLEEGNAFEADVVTGVEDARGADEREVRTHEVPEDDVPEEYLDKNIESDPPSPRR
jgi:hypothetical protein